MQFIENFKTGVEAGLEEIQEGQAKIDYFLRKNKFRLL